MSDRTVTRLTSRAGGGDQRPAQRVPPCGIEDVDGALFRALSRDVGLAVTDQTGTSPVRVTFASGERWSQMKRGLLRDENGALVLPLVAIVRTGVAQSASEDVCGRGINQQTGRITVRRAVSSDDASLQRLKNARAIGGAGQWRSPASGADKSTRETGALQLISPDASAGAIMLSAAARSLTETISVPAPQFVTVRYEIKIWTAYTTHMNQIAERLAASYLPCDRAIRLSTDKGYWFVAYFEEDGLTVDGSASSPGQDERLVRASVSVRVPAYIVAPLPPGAPEPARSTTSAATVSFDAPEVDGEPMNAVSAPFLGADEPALPLAFGAQLGHRLDARDDGSGPIGKTWRRDPALAQLRPGETLPLFRRRRSATIVRIADKHVRIQPVRAAAGETAYAGLSLADYELSVA